MADEKTNKQWEDFLNPAVVRTKLVMSGLFIVAYEMLERAVIERIASFYTLGFNENGFIRDPEYDDKVLSLDPKGKRDVLRSSLVWLEQHDVLSKKDVEKFIAIKNVRNEVAHELSSLIGGTTEPQIGDLFGPAVELLRKIEIWWIVNVEMATNPDWSDQVVDEGDIAPGTLMIIQILLDVALGEDEEAMKHLKAFQAARSTR